MLIGKPVVAFAIVWFMRYPLRAALTVSIALAQIGEFSFILATLGREIGVLPPDATNVLVATSIVSIVLDPLLYRTIAPAERFAAARPRLRSALNRAPRGMDVKRTEGRRAADPAHRAVVIGYGPTGRTVVSLLRDNGIEPTVIELNVENVRTARGDGIDVVYGDATRPETLEAAGIPDSGNLILGSAGMAHGADVIRMARAMNPTVRVLARAAYLRDVPDLRSAGADTVYSGEGEVALAFIENLLDRLGATPEQIDRERARAHRELFGPSAPAP